MDGSIKILSRSEDGSRARARIGGTEFDVRSRCSRYCRCSGRACKATAAARMHGLRQDDFQACIASLVWRQLLCWSSWRAQAAPIL